MIETKFLMKKIKYEFKNSSLIEQSLTHSSFCKNKEIESNYERLEFLGDRVLGLIISEEIFKRFKSSSEGDLAKKLSFLVCKSTLKNIADKINLKSFLRYSEKLKINSIDSIKANALEALIAAIYLDSDCNIKITATVVKVLWKEYLENINLSKFDPKSKLQEWCLKNMKKLPTYEVIKKSGPDHNPTFTIKVFLDENKFSEAQGKSKQEAEINAAQKILVKIGE